MQKLELWSEVVSVSLAKLFPPEDPELWDFTLDGIDMLDDPTRESAGLPRPATPSEHMMVTRSKTPQRSTSLRPPLQSHTHQVHQGQGGATDYRHNNSAAQNPARGTGKANLHKEQVTERAITCVLHNTF